MNDSFDKQNKSKVNNSFPKVIRQNLMIWGTGSGVGKHHVATGLCSLFRGDGHRIAPFKPFAIERHTCLLDDGMHVTVSQVIQSLAAGAKPSPYMSPLIAKVDQNGELIAFYELGREKGASSGNNPYDFLTKYIPLIKYSIDILLSEYDFLVIEGTGAPMEFGRLIEDVPNLCVAEMADAAVILVTDMGVGGGVAKIVGTLQLLDISNNLRHKDRVKGLILNMISPVNAFKPDLAEKLISEIEAISNKRVVGILPFFENEPIPKEETHKQMYITEYKRSDLTCLEAFGKVINQYISMEMIYQMLL